MFCMQNKTGPVELNKTFSLSAGFKNKLDLFFIQSETDLVEMAKIPQ